MTHQDYPVLTAEQFAEVLSTDRGLREAHFSRSYNLKNGCTGKIFFDLIHRHTENALGSQHSYKITDEQQAQADELFAQKRAQALAKAHEVGTLTFVAMGMDYESNIIGGLGNYRIRATFQDKKGYKWFVEVYPTDRSPKGNPDDSKGFNGTWTDVTFEEQEQERFERETQALIEKYGNQKNVPNRAWQNERKWPEQRHGHLGDIYAGCTIGGKPMAYKPTNGRKYTANDLRVWINETFGCNYSEFQLDRHFLSPDDYISRCMA